MTSSMNWDQDLAVASKSAALCKEFHERERELKSVMMDLTARDKSFQKCVQVEPQYLNVLS